MNTFPFKTLTRYRIRKTFTSQRSDDVFTEGVEVTYLSSSLNHYEGIEICKFRDLSSGRELIWHAGESDLSRHLEWFETAPWKKD